MQPVEGTGDLLMAAARGLRRRYLAAMADYDVTPGQSRALRSICAAAPVRLSVLADTLDIAPRSATEVVDALEGRGLVEREPDPADRRATRVVPTDQGRRVLRLIEGARVEESATYFAALSASDRAELERILMRLVGDGPASVHLAVHHADRH
jgi:DNA-binding MarR family transcriptional regulator